MILKKIKKVLVLVLVVAMVFSLAACNKKVIDDKDFEDIMEDLDYEVYEGYGDKKIDTSMYAYDEDMDYYVTFDEYDDKEDAIEEFEDGVDEMKDIKDDKNFDGTIKVSGSGNYKKCVVKGDFDEDSDMFDGDMYMVIVRVDNILITATTASTKDKAVDEVNKVIKELGY
jgi:hypothetical protein